VRAQVQLYRATPDLSVLNPACLASQRLRRFYFWVGHESPSYGSAGDSHRPARSCGWVARRRLALRSGYLLAHSGGR